MGHFVQLAHLVQVTLEARRRYVAYKVPVVHLVQFGQNCSVGDTDSKYRVAAIFPLPVWPLAALEARFRRIFDYARRHIARTAAATCQGARRSGAASVQRVRSRRVWRTLQHNITSLFPAFWPHALCWWVFKSRLLGNGSSDFGENFPDRRSWPALARDAISKKSDEGILGYGPPKFGVPQKNLPLPVSMDPNFGHHRQGTKEPTKFPGLILQSGVGFGPQSPKTPKTGRTLTGFPLD